ncbi:hypothetical protein [Sphingobacterium yanglingense]|uniref:LTXXQ motif family protein n=1 Tax=Sphingobacterium yanglingense TaxID=1437280 RepID=A0A4R6WB46_9SPHI|nr:hypothetical protein [Sphingobacterium yanglingense]TDQ72193.1 hypothetical protein CLV99_4656 [Sphingobacterium yanglingense]
MKTVFALAITTALSISIGQAQERSNRQHRSPEEQTKIKVERLATALNLQDSQKDSIYNYLLIFQKETKAENRRETWKQRDTKIKTFLTEEQVVKYDSLQNSTQNKRSRQNKT